MMKNKLKISIALVFILLIFLAVINRAEYNYPDKTEIDKRLNYLKRMIHQPLEEGSDIMKLADENHEFVLFSYSFAAYAVTNLAVKNPQYQSEAVPLIKECIRKALDKKIYSRYGIPPAFVTSDSLQEHSILYLGHLNLMMGCYRLLAEDTAFNRLNDVISGSLFDRYSKVSFLSLESYPSAIWIPDNTAALASLKLHSHNTGSRYEEMCYKWIDYAKQNFIEKETGVLYSTINTLTGKPLEEPRGSMLGWSIMFIYQFDTAFARNQYENYKQHFSDNLFALQLFRERHNSRQTNTGDIDSGPIILGYSIPANEFALSNAVLCKDYTTARKLERLMALGTKKIQDNNEIKYKTRLVDINASPMAEALVLHSLTITRWTD